MNRMTRIVGIAALSGGLFIGAACDNDDGDDGGVLEDQPAAETPTGFDDDGDALEDGTVVPGLDNADDEDDADDDDGDNGGVLDDDDDDDDDDES